jgi:hypothetical protein
VPDPSCPLGRGGPGEPGGGAYTGAVGEVQALSCNIGQMARFAPPRC